MSIVGKQYINENLDLLTEIGSISSWWYRAEYVVNALRKNYSSNYFQVEKNDYNDSYNIHVDEINILKLQEFKGFMRGVIVEKGWLE